MSDITITATRNPNNDMAWDEDSQEYIPSPTPTSNPTVRELEANGVVYDIVAKDLENADYVVEYQRPTAENNYTWYRLYKSGWVEQGGIVTTGTNNWITVPFPIKMVDIHYTGQITLSMPSDITSGVTYRQISFMNKTVNGFNIFQDDTLVKFWKVEGFAAQS